MRPHVPTNRVLLAPLACLALAAACRREHDPKEEARALTQGGEATHGWALAQRYGCGSCHEIPGVPNARGRVGPSLATLRERAYVGGVLPHTPENVMRWIEDPPGVDPRTAMPRLGVSHADARDITAYLYALEH